jgi:hypothetical protein
MPVVSLFNAGLFKNGLLFSQCVAAFYTGYQADVDLCIESSANGPTHSFLHIFELPPVYKNGPVSNL